MFILRVMVEEYRCPNLAKGHRYELLYKCRTECCMCAIDTIIGFVKIPISIVNTALFSTLPEFAYIV